MRRLEEEVEDDGDVGAGHVEGLEEDGAVRLSFNLIPIMNICMAELASLFSAILFFGIIGSSGNLMVSIPLLLWWLVGVDRIAASVKALPVVPCESSVALLQGMPGCYSSSITYSLLWIRINM